MRLLRSLYALSLLSLALSAPAEKDKRKESTPDPRKEAVASADDEPHDTVFNGQTVPPIPMLNGAKFEQEIAQGHWLVEAFSPYCGHCKHLAPKWQTLYEFYYTSDPVPASKDDPENGGLNSFSRYYNFKFGKLDCVAYADACVELGVGLFPTLVFFKDGQALQNQTGDLELEKLSSFIEESLEIIRPGSRPPGGVVLPTVGANGTGKLEGKDDGSKGSGVMKPADRPPSDSKPQEHDGTHLLPPRPKSKETSAPDGNRQPLGTGTTPNKLGISLPLSPHNFISTVTETLDPWLVKFYAPWCHHCQALAPIWSTMASTATSQLNVAEVDCEAYKSLCKEHGVKYYPTIQLIRGTENVEYTGLRGLGDLEQYAKTAAQDLITGIPDVTAASFDDFHRQHPVTFVYFYDHATASEDFMALERLPLHILGKARLVKSQDPDLASRFGVMMRPALAVSRDGTPARYDKLTPKEMRDVPALVAWMKAHWLPLVPELEAANAHDVMQKNFAVLAIMDKGARAPWDDAVDQLKAAAGEWTAREQQALDADREDARAKKQAAVDAAERTGKANKVSDAKQIKVDADKLQARRKPVSFAAVDGVFWERWVRGTFDVRRGAGARVVIYDHERRRFWNRKPDGSVIRPTEADVLEVLPLVTRSPPGMKSAIVGSGFTYWPFLVWYVSRRHPFWAGGLGLVVAVVWVVRRRWRGGSGSGSGSGSGRRREKEGLLGMTAVNGKAD